MSQDRRKNGWILIGSMLQLVFSMICLSAGIALGITGFLYKEKLATIDDLQFFIYQDFFTKLNLKIEFLYLFLGAFVAVIGLITLILAIITMVYVQKKMVVRRRTALMLFTAVTLAIVGCAETYLMLELDVLTDNIKYVLYGIIGLNGFISLCNILGIIFGRSEKFMSNDNSKFAFDSSSLRNSRPNNANMASTQQAQASYQQTVQSSPMAQARQNTAQMAGGVMPRQAMRPTSATARPVQPMHRVGPMPQVQPRPQVGPQGQRQAMAARPTQGGNQPPRAIPTQPRPMQARPPMPQPSGQGVKPAMPNGPVPLVVRYCPKCGKRLEPQEKICTLCGCRIYK